MRMNKEITPVDAATLKLIRAFIEKHGYSPTVAELAKSANVHGNAMCERLARLHAKGAITKTPRIARSIRLA